MESPSRRFFLKTKIIIVFFCTAALAVRCLGESPEITLSRAARAKDAKGVALALAQGANPNARASEVSAQTARYTPLAAAIEGGDIECVSLILSAGAKVSVDTGKEPWTHPLAMAQRYSRDPALFELLADHCEQLPEPDIVTDHILRLAAKAGQAVIISRLRRLGADFSFVSEKGICAPLAALEGGHVDLADEWLQQNEAGLRASPRKELDPSEVLQTAVAQPHLETDIARVLDQLGKLGFVFKERNRWDARMADVAVGYRLPNLARALGMTDEAKLRAIKPFTGEEIVRRAATRGTNEEFATLFNRYAGTNRNVRKRIATAALVEATEWDRTLGQGGAGRREQLLALGADINGEAMGRNMAKVTPLQAAVFGDEKLIDWLLAHGAELNRVGRENKCTALQWAVLFDQVATLKHLLAKGAKITDFEKGSLLVTVIRSERRERGLLELLLENGADPYAKPGGSQSAVEVAADKRDTALLRQLDVKHQQYALLAEYTPPKDSPFIGIWSNEKGEFATVSLILNEEGLAILGTAIFPMGWLPWKITGPNEAKMELSEKGRVLGIVLKVQDDGLLAVRFGDKPPELLKRQVGHPPSVAELAEKMRPSK